MAYEPHSLEAPKGFPAAGPVDGKIASAGGLFGGLLDQQSPTRWHKNQVATGPNTFTWTFTAAHKTSGWKYYMTKPGWNQNAPLTRDAIELIGQVDHDGSAASSNPSHTMTIPANRSGYHVVLAVWDIADTANAFYQVIDVNVGGAGVVDATAPTAPAGMAASNVTATTANLTWGAATDNVGVTGYRVYRNGSQVGTSVSPAFNDTGLTPATTYGYTVKAVDAAGNLSSTSNIATVTTSTAPAIDTEAPNAPTHLHSMGVTASTVDLMWGAATDNVGVSGYRVYRNGTQVGTSTTTTFLDRSGLSPATSYSYTVKAVDGAGNLSAASNTLAVTTAQTTGTHPAWNANGAYTKGDRVSHAGLNYECVRSYVGHGDPGWITAESLWQRI